MTVSNRGNRDGQVKRDRSGRFQSGTRPGPGNPGLRKLSEWRTALADAVSAKDLTEIMGKLVEKAKSGDPWAIHELLDRCLGRPTQALSVDLLEHEPMAITDEDAEIARRIAKTRLGPDYHAPPE